MGYIYPFQTQRYVVAYGGTHPVADVVSSSSDYITKGLGGTRSYLSALCCISSLLWFPFYPHMQASRVKQSVLVSICMYVLCVTLKSNELGICFTKFVAMDFFLDSAGTDEDSGDSV